ncbi:FecR family protein [Pseudodesulfovibrio sediminis]|uniref:FecR family protein n=1 Tax=Pseudodesulfovibrio sediminis TaxID=2810563 RepID=UPI001E2ACE8B|nr:FecR domain-containing protein [Pseudodesulfovibrio sediminis]
MSKISTTMFMAVLLVCLMQLAAFAAAEKTEQEFANAIGEVVYMMGTVIAEQPDGTKRTLDLNKQVIPGDVIVTGKKSNVEIVLKDDSVFAQGPSSRTSMDEYVFNDDPNAGKMLFKMGVGTFRYVTGKIVQQNPDGFALDTPTTTIGIRGTQVFAVITPDKEEIGNTQLTPGHTMSVGNQTITNEKHSVTVDPKTGEISAPTPTSQDTINTLVKNTPLTSNGETGAVGESPEDLDRKVSAFQSQIDRTKEGLAGVEGRPDYNSLHTLTLQEIGEKTAESERNSGTTDSALGGGGGDGGGGGGGH